jgi:glycine/D-amino acid oxidase-like deaminating enzyme
MVDFDVLVMGAGVAGLLTALKLLRHGYSVVLVDTFPLGRYASTRNQGWLLGGAMFAKEATSASAFRSSVAELATTFPSAIDDSVRAYYYFDRSDRRAKFEARCARSGVPFVRRSVEYVAQREPMIRGDAPDGRSFVEVQDRRINASHLMMQVCDLVLRHGGVFLDLGPGSPAKPTREADGTYSWIVQGTRVSGGALVSAVGAADAWDAELAADKPAVDTLSVLTVATPVVANIVAGPFVPGAANVVPYLDGLAAGISVTLNMRANVDLKDFRVDVLGALETLLPGLAPDLVGTEVACDLYQCAVRSPAMPRVLLKWLAQNHCVLMPAKMSVAAHAAERCVSELLARHAPGTRTRWSGRRDTPAVCTRASLQVGQYGLTSRDGKGLAFV